MFVQTNSIKSIKNYFKDKLSGMFSESEIKLIGNEVICIRLSLYRGDLIGIDDKLLSESDLLYFRSIVKRLLNQEPFQYIIGNAHFYGLELKSDSRALIPRPETEELIEWIKESYRNTPIHSIADICTGSGCIALSLKSIYLNSSVLAVDISTEALSLAKENSLLTKLEIELQKFDATNESEYLNNPTLVENSFDCWVSNPPYIPELEKKDMSENVLQFEPHLALFVPDNNALLFYKVISKMAKRFLKSNGLLFFEIHENLSNEVAILLEELGFLEIEIRTDLQGKNRMVKAQKK